MTPYSPPSYLPDAKGVLAYAPAWQLAQTIFLKRFYPGLKVLLGFATDLSPCATASVRGTFIQNVQTLLAAGWDGIDMDWEHHPNSDMGPFMLAVRAAVPSPMILATDVFGGVGNWPGWDTFKASLDFVNVMSYSTSIVSTGSSIQSYITSLGSPSKVRPGQWAAAITNWPSLRTTGKIGPPPFFINLTSPYTYDNVTYAENITGTVYCGYTCMAARVQWLKQKGCAGWMVFHIGNDYQTEWTQQPSTCLAVLALCPNSSTAVMECPNLIFALSLVVVGVDETGLYGAGLGGAGGWGKRVMISPTPCQ
ncbi:hypothetical protein HDU93_004700 [Gonapodya sp. JEL0774]|nr:hypothetical protein HDU93_004700 [Gonapodya sp. JEL0774]